MFYPKNMRGAVEPWLHLQAPAGEYKAGTLAMIGNTPYLCVADMTLEEGQLLPVQPFQVGQTYVTTLAEDAADLAVGSYVMPNADSNVVASEDGGYFVVEYLEGTTAGSEVHVRVSMM